MNKKEWDPCAILKLSGSYWEACALHTGVLLDIFTHIGDISLPAEQVASKIKGDVRATAMLLNALTAMDLLIKESDRYRNTDHAIRYLSKTSDQYMGFIIQHHHHLMTSWQKLVEAVATGKPVRKKASFDGPIVRESFLMGMFNMAMIVAPKIVPKIDLTGRRRLLDLGGGPGTYAIHFCKYNPGLSAVIFDLPTSRHIAEDMIERSGLKGKITFIGGNYIEDTLPQGFDVIWLSQILHSEGPEECKTIIGKAVAALEPQGLIAVHEFILNNEESGPLFPALFSLNMLVGTPHGQAYSENAIKSMLLEAGLDSIQRIPLDTPNNSGVIIGIKHA
ncbi:acetylserotonin O-methyltransferase [Dissulfurimicrobium hydrothermale]|uniref:acetylserotonin O-methyltransferase n=1 Tax=Dissulfurimicrobium hydrothermale TaxID=1750598 RepID=UPI001EDBAF54|nr:acetylserotonin O-methyltransferase [Dissulfurimicrobium hydrothermale]UKL13364.1 acetylserotonin O-methyltransferase [Dissulfurimicrobium hydrothermale]